METTAIVLLSAFIALGIFDAYVVWKEGVSSTISRALQRLGFRSPVAMLVIGMIIGHIFFAMEPEPCPVCIECEEVGK